MVTKKQILAFVASGIWISISEFIRNELLFKSYWLEKYSSLGLQFPSAPLNNALWGIWSFLLSFTVIIMLQKFRMTEAILITWLQAFVMMWIVIGNLDVLPFGLLLFAVPLSILEVAVAVYLSSIILKNR
jgi:hypothetical protein